MTRRPSARRSEIAVLDYESEVRERWAVIQAAVAGAGTSDDIDAVRAEMLAMFEGIHLSATGDGFFLSPNVRMEAIDGGWDRMLTPAGIALQPRAAADPRFEEQVRFP